VAFTSADLDAIRTAIARGERAVQFVDRSVTYRSMDELLAAEERIAKALAAQAANRRSKQSIAVGSSRAVAPCRPRAQPGGIGHV
jgi:hypothetical protein